LCCIGGQPGVEDVGDARCRVFHARRMKRATDIGQC
jgi:hypothetical protein